MAALPENTLTIERGSSQAEIDTTGAYVKSLLLNGKKVLKPSHDGKDTHGGMAMMLPFANRIRNGRYTWNGNKYELPKNSGNHSIHGLTRDVEWNVAHRGESTVSLSYSLNTESYPVPLFLKVGYELDEACFRVSIDAKNEGSEVAPFMAGMHPYFNFEGEWALESQRSLLKLNYENQYFPDGSFDPIMPGGIGSLTGKTYDTTFIAGNPVTFVSKGSRVRIDSEDMPYLVVYNGEYSEGRSVAIEPMTGAPDSFNNRIGIISLDPGASYRCGVSFCLEKHNM